MKNNLIRICLGLCCFLISLSAQAAGGVTCNAGSDKIVIAGGTASLSGSSGGGANQWRWTSSAWSSFLSGTSVTTPTLSTYGSINVTFTCTKTSNGDSDSDTMVINVVSAITVDAGSDKTINTGNTVSLSGSATVSGATVSSYAWTSSAWSGTLSGASVTTPVINNTAGGNYTVTLTVTDSLGRTNTDTMVITVVGITNVAPVANAGSDVSIALGGTATLNGTASTDSDGSIVSYAWTSSAWSGTKTGSTNSATISTAGTYTVTLVVTDNNGATGTDTMIITVNANSPPTANAGPDQTVTVGSTVTFNGSGSTDSDGSISTYSWNASGWASPLTGVNPTKVFSTAGSYTVTLTVTDNNGATATDQVVIVVSTATVSSSVFATEPMFLSCTGQTSGSATSVAFNTSTLSTDSKVYLSFFTINEWSGRLVSYALDATDGSVASTATWDSGAMLDSRNLSSNSRVILTNSGTDGTPFQWANLTVSQKLDLKTDSLGATEADAVGEARLNFLRGDISNEGVGYNFRDRDSRLGDIIHSTPVYVGKPDMDWPNTSPFPTTAGSTYSDFKNGSAKTRTKVLYVGANDGMLHGFRSDTGEEVLAYVPNNLYSNSIGGGLHYLTDPNYNHRYYVDLSPTVSDAYIATTTGGTASWRTVLVGGERSGGRGFFALDITDPTQFSESNAASLVLWEFTSAHDSDLGYSFSQPTIALMNNSRWAAVFGNGYNDSGSGQAKLFILFLDGGLDGTWTAGSDYVEISTGVGTTTARNGLSTPALVDTNDDGIPDRAYAGDTGGRMWVFDLSSGSSGSWGLAYADPLFSGNSTAPITAEPAVAFHPTIETVTGNKPNIMVYWGTGSYMYDTDPTNTAQQTFYGVWDDGNDGLTRSDLVQQTFRSGFSSSVRVLTDNTVPYTSSGSNKRYGWYIDMPSTGERVVTSATPRGELVYFNTLVPSTTPCSYGWLMTVKQETGGSPGSSAFDLDGDNLVSNADLVDNADNSFTGMAAAGMLFTGGIPSKSGFLSDFQYTASTTSESGADIEVRRVEYLGGQGTGRRAWEDLTGQ